MLIPQMRAKALQGGGATCFQHTQSLADGGGDQRRIVEWSKVNKPYPICEGIADRIRDGQRESRLTNTTRARDRQQPHIDVLQQLPNRAHFFFSSKQRSGLERKC